MGLVDEYISLTADLQYLPELIGLLAAAALTGAAVATIVFNRRWKKLLRNRDDILCASTLRGKLD